MMTDPQGLEQYKAGKGTFDVHYGCTSSPQALAVAIEVMRLRGVIMKLGAKHNRSRLKVIF